MFDDNENDNFKVGNQANSFRGNLTLNYPINNGIIENWDYMEKLWQNCFDNELREESYEFPVHLTCIETQLQKTVISYQKEKMITTFFEQFEVPFFYISNPAVLGLLATGRTTGLVVDSGEGITNIVPVYEGYSIKSSIQTLDIGGKTLTDFMRDSLLVELNIYMNQTSEYEIVKEIKEKICYVAENFESEMEIFEKSDIKEKKFDLPDGTSIILKDQRIRCPET